MPPEDNAAAYFIDRHLAEGRAHKIAFIDVAGLHSYESVALMVNRAGNLLRAIGVARHDRVMIVLEDGIEFVALFFGALKIGAVPIPINTLLAADDYRYLVSDAAPRSIAIAASIRERVVSAVGDRIAPTRVLLAGAAHPHFVTLGPALARVPDRLEPVPVTADEVGFWLYSSGSTAGPKGVLHRHGDLLQTARLYGERVLGIRAGDVVFSASKMFFAYGLGNTCSFPLHAGATAVLSPERLTPAAVLALLRRHQVTAFFGFPSLYAALLSTLDEAPTERLEHLRLCVSAGEALPVAIAERWAAWWGREILDGIGSTEALHIFISNREGGSRAGSSGKPVEGYEVAVRDERGREAGPDQVGDLWCRGPSIGLGYWNNPAATRQTFVDGWLRTGDKYFRDVDGFYHYCGRADDMIKVSGVWVSPQEVEGALLAHPEVLEAAVVGQADRDGLLRPKAFVVLKRPAAGSAELAERLRQFVKERIAPYKCPHAIEFRLELPKTATGKIRRALLRNNASAG
jgi:benzoate-CoA ligase family protein